MIGNGIAFGDMAKVFHSNFSVACRERSPILMLLCMAAIAGLLVPRATYGEAHHPYAREQEHPLYVGSDRPCNERGIWWCAGGLGKPCGN